MDAAHDRHVNLPFFVYGTLRPGEPNHAAYLHGRTVAQEPARWPDAVLYAGPGYPYAVEAAGHGPVHGELVTAGPASYDRLLVALDLLEEYVPGDPRNLYERVARDVIRPDGTSTRAWIYIAAPRLAADLLTSGTVIDGGDWTTPTTPTTPRTHH
ncbi:gamma-glutamylcyclotransferase family protein [Streptomyces sp. NPDC005865]|uniref:gamma-glutamylcyclotransferase family protein n=1 Tax=Streptomyces sp. NPDC005865 TaxID=3155453 RepID=UPI00340187E6